MPITKDEFEKAESSVHEFLIEKTKDFYEKQNCAVYIGKKIGRFVADLIVIRNETSTIAIEAKPNTATEIRKGVGQANSYLDWVHEVYLAVPADGVELCKDLLKYSPVGILTVMNERITFVKDAVRSEPERLKLAKLLNDTVGFCWLCGRTFNVVRSSQNIKESVYIAHKEIEPQLFKALEKIRGKKIRTKGIWVGICTVCSRIMGEAINEYLLRVFGEIEYPLFDFEDLKIDSLRDLFRTEA